MYLDSGKYGPHWANTSGNGLIGHLLRTGGNRIKEDFEKLMRGEAVEAVIDEQIIFQQLDKKTDAVWSLLLASGYLKCTEVRNTEGDNDEYAPIYKLSLTNREVRFMFRNMIREWFDATEDNMDSINEFIKAMFSGNEKDMNRYMNRVALYTFSSFDTGNHPSDHAPERFYHGFVLGLLVDQMNEYILNSDKDKTKPAVIMEFKVIDEYDGEKDLEDTAANALMQIENKQYVAELVRRGIPQEKILKYALAFKGKKCLVKKGIDSIV